MKIRTKLLLNIGVVSVSIVVISLTAVLGTRSIGRNIRDLTQRTIPYQMKALYQQRELQSHSTSLVSLAAARDTEEYKGAGARAAETLALVRKASGEMAKIKGGSGSEDGEIGDITRSIQTISERKLLSHEEAEKSSEAAGKKLSEMSGKMDELTGSVGNVQRKASGTMLTSVDSMVEANRQQQNLSVVRDGIKDLTLIINKIPATSDKRSVATLRDSFSNTVKVVTQALKGHKGIEKTADDFSKKLAAMDEKVTASRGLAFLQIKNISDEDEKQREVIEARAKEAAYELSYMLPTIDKEVERASANLKANTGEMSMNIDTFKSSNQFLAKAATLSLLSAGMGGELNKLLHAEEMKEYQEHNAKIEEIFRQMKTTGQELKEALTRGKHAAEAQAISAFLASLGSAEGSLYGKGGVAEKVKAVIASEQDLLKLNAQMKSISGKFLEESRKEVDKAGASQDDVVASLNRTAARTVQMVIATGAAVIAVTLALGLFISVSISRSLTRSTESLSEGLEQVTSASGQLNASSQSLAEGSSGQAASLEETASAMEEMSAMTRRNTESAGQAKTLSDRAGISVDKANASMNRMVGQMAEISSMGERIGKIIKTIDEIAFQTNLLALNAAVEAARAGEAGVGFAVVAEEVRNLAQRAAGAAKDTGELIDGAIRKIKDGTDLVEKTNADFSEVADSVKKVTELVGDVAAASSEQARGIGEVSGAVSQMDKVTQANAASAEEIASASEEMNAQALSLQEIVRSLRAMVEGEGARPAAREQAVSAQRLRSGCRAPVARLSRRAA